MNTSAKELLDAYVTAVTRAPVSLSLTATRDPGEFWRRHVMDALQVLNLLPAADQQAGLKVMDVGSGNGIPGLVAAISCPSWKVSLLDSNNKKCGFLDMFCAKHAIKNVMIIHSRAEKYAHYPQFRSKFDIVFTRAFAKLPVAIEICMPFAKQDGKLIVPHGTSYREELKQAGSAMEKLNCGLAAEFDYQIDGINFKALEFRKSGMTPEQYPRNAASIKRSPL